ncbi:MAG: hypothetical protein KDI39_06655 [Pseudomonadales bacterium]|nr:hypothetical protein [Pseudomonadales bacterium]
MNDRVHDDRLSKLYQQMPKEQVPEHIRNAILAAAHKQAIINAQNTKAARLHWFKALFIGMPAYALAGVALCILAVVVIIKPLSSAPSLSVQQQVVTTQEKPQLIEEEPEAIAQQKPTSKLRVAPVESADTFRLPDESVQVAEVSQVPRIEIHGRTASISTNEPTASMSSHVPSSKNTAEEELIKIRLLKALGKQQEATNALKDFQLQHPQQAVPKDLQDLIQSSE